MSSRRWRRMRVDRHVCPGLVVAQRSMESMRTYFAVTAQGADHVIWQGMRTDSGETFIR